MSDPRRQLPSVDRLLGEPALAALLREVPRGVVVAAARAALDEARAARAAEPGEGWASAVARRVREAVAPSLCPVVNATGVVLHTNLGRAPLAQAAVEAIARAAPGYSTLEYDLAGGTRGSRQAHCRRLLRELTGGEDALVVNNAAGGLLLALAALAGDGTAVVSRGELIEIGGSFRLPEIVTRSGARLVEVGTTNRTHRSDYQEAITDETRLLLKVHRSNFRLSGFTAEVSASDVARLAEEHGLWSFYDLGSGLLFDLSPWGLAGEPLVGEALATGMDAVLFSGDKLLGGPQAGVLVGARAALERLARHPIARAVRADKLTLAALEATLALYRDPERARTEIPVLWMLTRLPRELEQAASELRAALPATARAEIRAGSGEVGGGSFSDVPLPTTVVTLAPEGVSAAALAERLRADAAHVVGRVADDRVVLDLRTIFPTQLRLVAAAVTRALGA